jgi:four helix bundle protein
MNEHPRFDHEKLDVYRLELEFIAWVTTLLSEVKQSPQGTYREVCDQLDRASLSALLNTAEGKGKRQGRHRAKFFDDSRGSAVECAACLDALVAKQLVPLDRIIEGKRMLLRIVGMLSKLVERFDDDSYRFREGDAE